MWLVKKYDKFIGKKVRLIRGKGHSFTGSLTKDKNGCVWLILSDNSAIIPYDDDKIKLVN